MQHPDLDLLALAALPAEPPDHGVVAHLADCPECREHVADLKQTVELARVGHAETATPPPRVWQAILDELEADKDAEPLPVDRPLIVVPPTGGSPRRSRWRAATVPIAAALAGIAAGLAIAYALTPKPEQPPASSPIMVLARLQPIGQADPAAAGTVDTVPTVGSRELVINVQGVTNTAGGDYLEAWLIDPAGTRLVSLGALTPTPDGGGYQGQFTLPADLPMSTFNTVDISAERWDGNPDHSRISLLRGSMA